MCAQEFDTATVLQYVLESSILQQFCNMCLRVRYCDSFAMCAQESNTATVLLEMFDITTVCNMCSRV